MAIQEYNCIVLFVRIREFVFSLKLNCFARFLSKWYLDSKTNLFVALIYLQEWRERQQKVKMYESAHFENAALVSLCEILFPADDKSVWRGPHSLAQHHVSARTNSIHAAIGTLMNRSCSD